MNLRSQLRALFIQVATRVRADDLALRLQKRRNRTRGVVVSVHETPKSLESNFRDQLQWVSQHFTISNLNSFTELCRKCQSKANSRPPILFTFDDGRESNYEVAAPLLESFGGRGLFFIVPAFAECSPQRALDFYRTKINPNSRPGDEQWEDWKPMSPAQIAELVERGHAIGSHTLTHARLAGLPQEDLEREVGESARLLVSWTNHPVESFAWTFGWDSVDANAFEVIQRHHQYCFAPCAGTIDAHQDTNLLWRREIEVKYEPAEYRFLYSGLADAWWGTRRRHLREMLQLSNSNPNPKKDKCA
ncbi:MAG: polysaccharide deacetylase family protein [Candidatus Sulfotelmatobacter sp.]